LAALGQDFTGLRIGEQIEIAVAVAVFFVGERAMNTALVVLLAERHGPERLRQQRELLNMEAGFACARFEGEAAHADEIAEVEVVEPRERLFAQVIPAGIDLYAPGLVADVSERDLALRAMCGQA